MKDSLLTTDHVIVMMLGQEELCTDDRLAEILMMGIVKDLFPPFAWSIIGLWKSVIIITHRNKINQIGD